MAGNTERLGAGVYPGAEGPVRIADAYFPVETLGPGRRLALWFQGCALACPGCMSRHTWDADGGRAATVGDLLQLWDAALADGAEGLTVSGGEPLQQPSALAALLLGAGRLRLARGRPEADLLVYTGHEPGEVPPEVWAALDGADAVVTGRFRIAEPTDLVWRGSANQRLVPRTPLGARRYAPHLDRDYPRGPRVTVHTDGTHARVYGVPARGELRRLERASAATGVHLTDPSWRP
ncbi:4Fe-4S single cluster domain-containing protein [Streptomyces aurantiogriseus]|uniref:Radical activating enzyme n=1 Tax=Streptomyces aurantiogriseus TaxID=66870 RepID=A0A918F1P3_9ACTN|nr:4Fe-4S single cluster domain-containing protein [Streptomyces aurantiogriseus]GGQ99373.1 radical activating enzyme [Streptomyces aurantiogriseus]